MTRAFLILLFTAFVLSTLRFGVDNLSLKRNLELSEDICELQNEKILLLEQNLELEEDMNIQLDSMLIICRENSDIHSSRLQDANWRLIQIKRLIEDGKKD